MHGRGRLDVQKGDAFFKTKTFLWAAIKSYTRKAQREKSPWRQNEMDKMELQEIV